MHAFIGDPADLHAELAGLFRTEIFEFQNAVDGGFRRKLPLGNVHFRTHMLCGADPGLVIAQRDEHPVFAEIELIPIQNVIRTVHIGREALIPPDDHDVRSKETDHIADIDIINTNDLHQQRGNTGIPQLDIAGYLTADPDDGTV